MWGWLKFVSSCIQRRNKRKEFIFRDLYFSLPLLSFFLSHLVIEGEMGQRGGGGKDEKKNHKVAKTSYNL